MAFRVGQKVVCVDASPAAPFNEDGLTIRAVYTVRGFSSIGGVFLEEVADTSKHPWGEYRGWSPTRFRPVIEKSTDTGMAILREILDRESVTERVPLKA